MAQHGVVTISATFRLKRRAGLLHHQAPTAQQFGQNMVRLDLQALGAEFDGHVAVAQMVGRPHQVKRVAVIRIHGDAQDALRRGLHLHPLVAVGQQHIATANHRTAWQVNGHAPTFAVHAFKSAFLPGVPIQDQARAATDQRRSQALTLGQTTVGDQHGG